MQLDPNERVVIQEGGITRVAKRKHIRFKLLLLALTNTTKLMVNDGNRTTFYKLAWALGEAGEPEACAAIMKAAEKKPDPIRNWYMGMPF